VEKFDQKISPARPIAEERANFRESGVIEGASLRAALRLAAACPKASPLRVH
jgi:hypothetical protein